MIAPTSGLGILALGLVWVVGWGLFAWRAWQLYRYLRVGRNEDRTRYPLRRIRDRHEDVAAHELEGDLGVRMRARELLYQRLLLLLCILHFLTLF